MKKASIGLAVAALVLLTGCGNSKKLTCTQEQSYGTTKMEAKAVISFKGDYATQSETTITATFDDETTAKSFVSYYSDKSDYKVKQDGKKVTVTQVEKISEKEAKADVNKYDAVKKTLTEEGFTCK